MTSLPFPPPSSGLFGLELAGLGLEGAVLGVLSHPPPSSSLSELDGLIPVVLGAAFFGSFQLFLDPFHRSRSLAPLLLLGLVTPIPTPPTCLFRPAALESGAPLAC